MRAIAAVVLVILAGCAEKPPVVAGPSDPAEPFRPACRERWQTTFAIEKCAQDALEASRGGSATAVPAAAPPAPAAPPAAPAARRR
ncbi:hypothetical protein LPC08_12310 [Roseomonas sp. OT10]|uniref:hypothetical protein n=1 Tax=Roseomonas cutis TaxID=2897332 RepID=UPI001E549927|nr:hypothetical protein [Roseomonas sp. OT10]UFN46815.1 hypothetical protein LPC08_12310 [Roseomonas sp. OT10]